MERRGALDEAFEALEELAERTDDPEVRELLARQLQAHGRSTQAVQEYRRAFASRMRAGDHVGADALREEIRGIDAVAAETLEADLGSAPAEAAVGEGLPFLPELGLETVAGAAGIADTESPRLAAPPLDLEPAPLAVEGLDLAGPVSGETEAGSAQPADEAVAGVFAGGSGISSLPLEGMGAASAEADEDVEPLPLMELDESSAPLPLLEEPEEEAAGLPFLEEPEKEAEPSAAGDLPLLEEPAAPALQGVVRLPGRPDPLEDARSLYWQGRGADGRRALEGLVVAADAAGDRHAAMAALAALVEMEPDELNLHQRNVEASFRLVGARGAVPALLGLAAALERAGLGPKASVAYQQVLDIDPSNAAAGEALRRERASRPLPKDDGNYINLGALLLEEEEPQVTRYVVDAAPSGDEERDFVEMLERFKDKVAEHMGEDPQAHYDLGLAYKEMGLVDEAIAEFQIALRNGQDRLRVLEELGRCFLLKEQPNIALKILEQALSLPRASEVESMGVYYLLGCTQQELGNTAAARDAFEHVMGYDIQFQDVAERLARL